MAKKATQARKKPASVLFLPGVFNDTLQLLLESYEYFQQHGVEDQMNISSLERTAYTCEMSRLTMRLSTVMAWLMIRKAEFAGKLSAKEANQKFQFETKELCLTQNIEAEHILPPPMRELLERSLQLYERVVRLDAQLREAAPPPKPRPKKKKSKNLK